MSNVYDIFSGNKLDPAYNPARLFVEQTLEEARAQITPEALKARSIVTVSRNARLKLAAAAVRMEKATPFLVAHSLGALIADAAFQLTEEDLAADVTERAVGYQLERSFYETVSEFASWQQTTTDLLADVAVKRYLVIVPPDKQGNPFRPTRHLRGV